MLLNTKRFSVFGPETCSNCSPFPNSFRFFFFVSIARQQEIKAGLYLMLLQKREENAITLAATANNARIIDEALADDNPVSPKRMMVYLAALVLGVGFPADCRQEPLGGNCDGISRNDISLDLGG